MTHPLALPLRPKPEIWRERRKGEVRTGTTVSGRVRRRRRTRTSSFSSTKLRQPSFGTKAVTAQQEERQGQVKSSWGRREPASSRPGRRRQRRERGRTLLAVLDELNADTLADGRVGLLGLNTDLLEDDALGVRGATGRRRTVSGAEGTLLVVLVSLWEGGTRARVSSAVVGADGRGCCGSTARAWSALGQGELARCGTEVEDESTCRRKGVGGSSQPLGRGIGRSRGAVEVGGGRRSCRRAVARSSSDAGPACCAALPRSRCRAPPLSLSSTRCAEPRMAKERAAHPAVVTAVVAELAAGEETTRL